MERKWHKNIILFLTSQTISLFGSMLVQYAITWFITLKTQSGSMMTVAIICGFIPSFILSPFAGVWADRYNRKKLIIAADSMIAVATLILAILFLIGYDRIWLLFLMLAIRAVGTGIHTPSIGAFLPQLVPEDKLTKINAANGSIHSLVMLLSPMLSGALLSITGIEIIFFIDVVTAAIAVFILSAFLHVPAHKKALQNNPANYFKDMHDGYEYIRNHDYVKKFFLFSAFFFFFVAPAAFLTPLQVTRSFGGEFWRLTAIEIAFSIGMLSGGIVMASWGGFRNKVYTMSLANVVIGICTIALGIIPVFWIYLSFMVLTGIALQVFSTPSTVLLQQKVEGDYLGRVFGVYGMLSSFMMPLGMLVFGPVSDMVRIEILLLGTGVILIFISLLMLSSKTLVTAGQPDITSHSD